MGIHALVQVCGKPATLPSCGRIESIDNDTADLRMTSGIIRNFPLAGLTRLMPGTSLHLRVGIAMMTVAGC